MWPTDTVTSVLDHAFIACDKNGAGTVFVRHMSIDPSGSRGGYSIVDLTIDGRPFMPVGNIVPYPAADTWVRPASDFSVDVSAGNLPGLSQFIIIARNNDIDPGTVPETIWSGGGQYQFLATPRPLQVRSTSALDTLTGSGAQRVLIAALNADYQPTTLTVDLAGMTPVVLGTWLRVNDVRCLRDGPPGFNEGEIIIETADLPTVRVAHIAPRDGRAAQAAFTVPASTDAFVTYLRTGMYRPGPGAQSALIECWYRIPGRTWVRSASRPHHLHGNTTDADSPVLPPGLPAGTDIRFDCVDVSEINTMVYANLQFLLRNVDSASQNHGSVDINDTFITEVGDHYFITEVGDHYFQQEG